MMSKIRRRAVLCLAAGLALAPAQAVLADNPIRIGAINPYSGGMALYGDELARGYELAADWVNAQGGVLGRQVEILRGNASNPQEGIAAVEQLARRVDAFVGTYISAVANAASDAAMIHDRLYWDTNALAAELTQRGLPNFVRVGPYSGSFADRSAEAVIGLIAPTMGKAPGELTVWLEHEESIYGTTIAERQKELLEAAGVRVVGVGAHDFRSIDLTDSILRARNTNPDVWVNTGYVPDTNLLLQTARDQGFRPGAILLVGTGDTFETRDALGADYLDGILVVGYPRPDVDEAFGPGAARYLQAYRDRFGADPIAPQGMTAYVGARILFEAMEAAGSTDTAAVRAAAAAMDRPLNSYATGFGVLFDENFQNLRAVPTVAQWQGGNVVTVFPAEATGGEAVMIDLHRR